MSVSLEQRVEGNRRTVKGILSVQEHRFLLLMAEGYSDQEIADHLGVATGTVRIILQKVRDRLEARNRAHCVHIAHQAGLLDGETSKRNRPARITRAPRTPKTGDAPSGGELFRKVGAVYRAKDPASLPPGEPTHYLCAVHPTDKNKSWEIDIAVLDDVEARRRMNQLAGWVYPPFRISLRRAGPDGRQIDSVAAFCRPSFD